MEFKIFFSEAIRNLWTIFLFSSLQRRIYLYKEDSKAFAILWSESISRY